MRNILDLLIDDFHERPLPDLMPRQQSMAQVAGKANCVVGMRRAGKRWFCYQQMRQLLLNRRSPTGLAPPPELSCSIRWLLEA